MANLFYMLHIFGANNTKPASPDRMRQATGTAANTNGQWWHDDHFRIRGPTQKDAPWSFLASGMRRGCWRCPKYKMILTWYKAYDLLILNLSREEHITRTLLSRTYKWHTSVDLVAQ
jgi:hypothetical protein